MLLYNRDDCPYCWKVRLVLSFAGVSFETITVERGTKHPDMAKYNTGTVPIMIDEVAHDKLVLTESAIQAEYINEAYAKGMFLTSTPSRNAAIRQLHQYSDATFGKPIFAYLSEIRNHPQEERRADIMQQAEEDFAAGLRILSTKADILGGAQKPNLADCALYPRFALAKQYGLDFTKEPQFVAWFDEMTAHRAVQAAEKTA